MSPSNENRNVALIGLFGVLTVILVMTVYAVLVYSKISDMQNRGLFGDMFGALNTFFSGLAFLGVIIAIIIQQKQLQHQRQEMQVAMQAQDESVLSLQKELENSKTQIKIDAINHLLVALDRRISIMHGFRTQQEKTLYESLILERESLEEKLRNLMVTILD
jgi:hypothetical protein